MSTSRPECPRCHGAGHIKAYHHVKAGICFRCWGLGDDLPAIHKALVDRLQERRNEYSKARCAGADQATLEEIVVRGKRAASALFKHEMMVQGLKAEHSSAA